MISEQQMRRDGKSLEPVLERRVSRDLAVLGEIAGDDAQIGIAMMRGDIGQRRIEARERVKPPQQFVRRHQMQVGEMDEFHIELAVSGGVSLAGTMEFCLSREPRSNPAASAIG